MYEYKEEIWSEIVKQFMKKYGYEDNERFENPNSPYYGKRGWHINTEEPTCAVMDYDSDTELFEVTFNYRGVDEDYAIEESKNFLSKYNFKEIESAEAIYNSEKGWFSVKAELKREYILRKYNLEEDWIKASDKKISKWGILLKLSDGVVHRCVYDYLEDKYPDDHWAKYQPITFSSLKEFFIYFKGHFYTALKEEERFSFGEDFDSNREEFKAEENIIKILTECTNLVIPGWNDIEYNTIKFNVELEIYKKQINNNKVNKTNNQVSEVCSSIVLGDTSVGIYDSNNYGILEKALGIGCYLIVQDNKYLMKIPKVTKDDGSEKDFKVFLLVNKAIKDDKYKSLGFTFSEFLESEDKQEKIDRVLSSFENSFIFIHKDKLCVSKGNSNKE